MMYWADTFYFRSGQVSCPGTLYREKNWKGKSRCTQIPPQMHFCQIRTLDTGLFCPLPLWLLHFQWVFPCTDKSMELPQGWDSELFFPPSWLCKQSLQLLQRPYTERWIASTCRSSTSPRRISLSEGHFQGFMISAGKDKMCRWDWSLNCRHVPTLVLDLDDVLVHSEWTRGRGWRTFKRPGVEDFIKRMAPYYEIVVYTSQVPPCCCSTNLQKCSFIYSQTNLLSHTGCTTAIRYVNVSSPTAT